MTSANAVCAVDQGVFMTNPSGVNVMNVRAWGAWGLPGLVSKNRCIARASVALVMAKVGIVQPRSMMASATATVIYHHHLHLQPQLYHQCLAPQTILQPQHYHLHHHWNR